MKQTNNLINPSAAMSLADCIKHADETKELICDKNALEKIPALLSGFYQSDTVCLIADENTFRAAGKKVKDILESSSVKILGVYLFPGEPRLHAEYDHVETLVKWISSLGGKPVPVSVGAGTVNDLVKRASYELKAPYLSVPTAASVDGFTPNGAALLMDGYKQTLVCTAPMTLAADMDIIAMAPAYLSSSGFGDLASKIITGTDWIIAEKAGTSGAVEAPPVDSVAWGMVQHGLLDALKRSVNAAKGDREAVKALFEALAVTGFSMQYYKNSRPVSGAEHLWSHVWEMDDLCFNGVPVTHGHKVTIGTLAATAFTEIFFADPKGPPEVSKSYRRPDAGERKAEVMKAFANSRARDGIAKTALEKMMEQKTIDRINEAFRDTWKETRDRVYERLVSYGELKAMLEKAGCPLRPEEVGLTRSETVATARRAQMMRNKYCILDLSWDMGNFEKVLEEMEESAVYLR